MPKKYTFTAPCSSYSPDDRIVQPAGNCVVAAWEEGWAGSMNMKPPLVRSNLLKGDLKTN